MKICQNMKETLPYKMVMYKCESDEKHGRYEGDTKTLHRTAHKFQSTINL